MLATGRASGADGKLNSPWTTIVGKISLADLNSKCDVVLTGKIERSTDVSANPPVTEINVTRVLAARRGLEGEFDSVITNASSSKMILLFGSEALVRRRSDVVLLSGGEYLFWLTRRTNDLGSGTPLTSREKSQPTFFEPTNNRASVYIISEHRGLPPIHPRSFFEPADNWRSVFCISDPELLRIIHSMPIQPYAWQGEMVAECVGTNDINKFVSISYQLVRALRPKADSVLELTALTKVKSNPALAKIASQHLTRGVTNNFSYVNLRFLDNNP